MFASLTGPFIILLPLADNNAKQNFLAGFYVLVHFAHTYTNSLWSLQLKVAGTFWQLLSAAHAFLAPLLFAALFLKGVRKVCRVIHYLLRVRFVLGP